MRFFCVGSFGCLHIKQAIRKESVDSAPWFSFTRSGEARLCIRPSLHHRAAPRSFLPRNQPKTRGLLQAIALSSVSRILETGRDRCAGFDGLLIETRLLFSFDEESAGADGHKYLRIAAMLRGDKPFKRFHPSFNHSLVFAAPSGQNERLRQSCIRVGKALLKPMPGLGVLRS